MKFVLPELPQPSIVLAGVGDNPGRSIEDTLQLVGCLLWRTNQEAATVVDPASDDCEYGSSSRVVSRELGCSAVVEAEKNTWH